MDTKPGEATMPRKRAIALSLFFMTMTLTAQNGLLESCVYRGTDPPPEKQETPDARRILDGATNLLDRLTVDLITILPGARRDVHPDTAETLIILQEGNLGVRLDGEHRNLGPLSVVMIQPGGECQCQNTGTVPAAFYVLALTARESVRPDRPVGPEKSFMVDYKDLEFQPHDKGGLRRYYRRSTAMFQTAEMHVTTLNPKTRSHEPHAHGAAEIVLMISGNTKMQIGEDTDAAGAGDLYYLESGVSHAIQNSGDESCMYFAVQWE
jgi:(S)-ureidoglycine aminohydrolase